MPSRDVFALDRSGLNGFLFAAIGTEAGGSRLTVLSALARLGEDPWAKAAIWARMPKAASGEALAATIAQMPVTPEDQLAAADTAARLVQLLSPAVTPAPRQPGSTGPQPRPRLFLVLAMFVWTAILLSGAILASRQGTEAQAPPAEPAASHTPDGYRTKNPMLAAAMIAVASQPPTSIGSGNVRRPMMRPLAATSMTAAMTGAASTPLTTALQ